MNDRDVVACLDIGGSSIKSGIVMRNGRLIGGKRYRDPVDSGGRAPAILGAFSASLAKLLDTVREKGLILEGVGVAICGPFDYEGGISKIKGLDKYEALYDVNVKEHLGDSLALPADLPLLFDVDAWSFGRGEVWTGAGRGFSRVIIFTMGTGVGSAFAVDGRIVDEGPGVPWLGWISGQPYRDGILNDYVSSIWMARRYRTLAGSEIDPREMAVRARQGDGYAAQVFAEMGATLGRFVGEHHLEQFGAECFIFGGQIANACDLFVEPFRNALGDETPLQRVMRAMDIECSALRGAAKLVFDSLDEVAEKRQR